MIKKVIISFVFVGILMSLMAIRPKASYGGITKTGHSDIVEMDFVETNRGYKLLNQMDNSTIESAYKNVKRTAFGWSAKVINNEIPVWYISEVILSKSNNTANPLTYSYTLRYSTQTDLEVSASGSIALKLSGKIKGITGNLETTVKASITKTVKDLYEEKTSFDVIVPPGKKVSLLVRGDGELSTGVGKKYFLGIPLKKGTWEYISLLTEYYELYEEDL